MDIYQQRRQAFMQAMAPDSIALLPTAPIRNRNNDNDYYYRSHSDFVYLTGFTEASAVALFIPGRLEGEYVLFSLPKDPKRERWDGLRAGQKKACLEFQADAAYGIDDLAAILPTLLEHKHTLYYPFNCDPAFEGVLRQSLATARSALRKGISAPDTLVEIQSIVHPMRLIKSEAECAKIQRSVDISVAAHLRVMRACRPGLYEYELEAELLHEFYRQGARSVAYNSIVAGGDNACILHYLDNAAQLQKNDLLLVDAGCEYQYYASDITRTFPVSGRFSDPQRALYDVVLRAQQAALDGIRPGAPWNVMQDAIVEVLSAGLVDLGIVPGSVKQCIESKKYEPYYMHQSGHWMGLDVHDVGSYKQGAAWRPLEAGMVLTVEPGIYIDPLDQTVDAKWRGMGIRIEDDVLVTPTGYRIFSEALPKSIEAIEDWMTQA